MSGLNPQAMAVLREHHGVATLKMLRDAGVGRVAVDRLIEHGVLTQHLERVVRIASTPETEESRCAELCLAFPRAFITGPTAGRLTKLRRMGPPDNVHLSVPHGSNIGPINGVNLRQTTKIHVSDVQAVRRDGIRLASAPRLAFDLAADLVQRDHASIVEQILHERRCTWTTLLRTARRLAHPLRPGSAVMAMTIAERAQRTPAESHGEVQLGTELRKIGVPVEPQLVWLDLPNGSRARVDLSVSAIRWGIEVDLHPDHLLRWGTTKDKRRDRQCHLIGWEIERVTDLDLLDLDGLLAELKALYVARVVSVGAA